MIRKLSRNIRIYGEISSTNEELNRLLKEEELEEGAIVKADFQTSGKGYQGNIWQSERGMNLLFSILLKPEFLKIKDAFQVSRICSLAIAEVIDKQKLDSCIKWPNDILIGNRKVCGILIENSMLGDRILHSVIGIGLNVNQGKFNSDIPAATSLFLEKGCQFDMNIILEDFRSALESWYQVLIMGHTERIMDAYLDRLYLFDEPAAYSDGESEFMARISGVLPGGELELVTDAGELRTYGFKEIEYLV